MALTSEQFASLVQRLEKFSRQQPAAYKFRVGLLAALGYAYVLTVLLLLCGAVWLIAGGLNWMTVIFWLAIGQMFCIRYKLPQGIAINRQQFPELFAAIDEVSVALKAPACHHVRLTNELNAGVIQVARFGLFGFYHNYLFIGLPLMHSVSPAQFRSTLAHELAHLSGNHSQFGAWIYRLRNVWYHTVEMFNSYGQAGSFLFASFFDWYEPFFRAYSFVLARANEYEADRCAAELTNNQTAAEELINIYLKSYFMEISFLPNLYKQAIYKSEPPEATISQLLQVLPTVSSLRDAEIWLALALAETTDNEDTHPSLAERLDAYGYDSLNTSVAKLAPISLTAAEYFFGHKLANFSSQLDAQWQKEFAHIWKYWHHKAKQQQQNLALLDEKTRNQTLTLEEAAKRAYLNEELGNKLKAIALFRSILKKAPHHAFANYHLGDLLLQEKNEQGIYYLEIAIAQNSFYAVGAYKSIYIYLKQQGRNDEARLYLEHYQQQRPLMKLAQEERLEVTIKDKFMPHDLPADELSQITAQLAKYPEIKQAFLVCKQVKYFPEQRLYVLGIIRKFVRREYKSDSELIDQIIKELNFCRQIRAIVLTESNRRLYQVFRRVEAARLK